ncbi:MAG: hypothetical protein K9M11_04725 [Candidatus Pacebacteria bacterium]|nr:hypothetical protein [Candidatus Paceibacterota bacterium]
MNRPEKHLSFETPTGKSRQELTNDAVIFLEKTGAFELFNDPVRKSEWIQTTTAEEAEQYIERLNGILIGNPIYKREIYENPGILVDPDDNLVDKPTNPEISRHLFRDLIFPACQRIPINDASELMATSINLLHMFPDGNGRTSRSTYSLFFEPTRAKIKPQERKEFLEWQTGEQKGVLNWNPRLIRSNINSIIRNRIDSTKPSFLEAQESSAFPEEILNYKGENLAIQSLRETCLSRDPDVAMALIMHAGRNELNPDEFIVKGNKLLNNQKILESVDESTAVSVLECLETIKMLRVVTLVDVFEHPNEYKSPIDTYNLKEYFELLVKTKALQEQNPDLDISS